MEKVRRVEGRIVPLESTTEGGVILQLSAEEERSMSVEELIEIARRERAVYVGEGVEYFLVEFGPHSRGSWTEGELREAWATMRL